MKMIALGTIVATIFGSATLAQTIYVPGTQTVSAGHTAYPADWAGGPPIGAPAGQPAYVQPQAQVYVQPQTQVYVSTSAYASTAYTTQGYTTPTYVSPTPQTVSGVSGPVSSRCIVQILNAGGSRGVAGCGHVYVRPSDVPHLRKKFSRYQSHTGYALNLPSDAEYTRN